MGAVKLFETTYFPTAMFQVIFVCLFVCERQKLWVPAWSQNDWNDKKKRHLAEKMHCWVLNSAEDRNQAKPYFLCFCRSKAARPLTSCGGLPPLYGGHHYQGYVKLHFPCAGLKHFALASEQLRCSCSEAMERIPWWWVSVSILILETVLCGNMSEK
jgi:hypothetical protein